LKVLIFAHNFPPAIDGGAKLLSSIALGEKKRGNEVRVLTSDAHSSDDYLDWRAKRLKTGWAQWRGMLLFRAKTWRWPKQLIRRITGPVFLWLPVFWLYRWRPKKIVAGVFPTIIPVYAWLLAKITRAKLVLVPCFHYADKSFYRSWLTFVLRRADKILALTNFEKSFYQKKLGIDEKRITIFRPKISSSFLLKGKAKFKNPPMILFLGSLSAHKRVEFLIKAYKTLPITLVIAGPKTLYWPQIKKTLAKLPLKTRKRIRVLGKIGERKKIQLLDRAWVLVNPSIHESLGLVFLEAWARKKPVVAADIPILREVISNGENGLLFKKNNINDLAEKIRKIITNKNMAMKMGETGYKNMLK